MVIENHNCEHHAAGHHHHDAVEICTLEHRTQVTRMSIPDQGDLIMIMHKLELANIIFDWSGAALNAVLLCQFLMTNSKDKIRISSSRAEHDRKTPSDAIKRKIEFWKLV